MATASFLLSEEKFLCPVCLDVFTEPVSTPCGHNFCRACIHKYWDSTDICQCPFCKRVFSPRPELHVNTVMSELAAEFKMSVKDKFWTPDPQLPDTADIFCDICSEMKEKAIKSCLTCLVSYCEVHLEPHERVAGLKSHTLVNPVKKLEDRVCKMHNKITDMYCRTDQACICVWCFKTKHKSHDVVPLEEEYEAVLEKKDETMSEIRKMVQSRSRKIVEIENSVNISEKEAEKEKEASVKVFTELISSIQRSQAKFFEVIEERLRETKLKAEGFLTELKTEIAELQRRSNQLEQLSKSEDHLHFLQSFPTLCSPLDKDWDNIAVRSDLSCEAVRRAVTQLNQRVDEIMEGLPEIKMKTMREHAVDLTFDPDTAFCLLVISQDGKQVIYEETDQNPPYHPKRFEIYPDVLAKEGFTTGKFYYEVQVEGKTNWIVGVVRESVSRKKTMALSVKTGAWNIGLDNGLYQAYTAPRHKITLKDTLHKVGIFVDYNKGVVSFYNVDSKSHIYSFTRCHFKEKIYPFFGLQGIENGKTSVPLIITPVAQTH